MRIRFVLLALLALAVGACAAPRAGGRTVGAAPATTAATPAAVRKGKAKAPPPVSPPGCPVDRPSRPRQSWISGFATTGPSRSQTVPGAPRLPWCQGGLEDLEDLGGRVDPGMYTQRQRQHGIGVPAVDVAKHRHVAACVQPATSAHSRRVCAWS